MQLHEHKNIVNLFPNQPEHVQLKPIIGTEYFPVYFPINKVCP